MDTSDLLAAIVAGVVVVAVMVVLVVASHVLLALLGFAMMDVVMHHPLTFWQSLLVAFGLTTLVGLIRSIVK